MASQRSRRHAVFEHLSSERSLDTYPTRIKSISLTKFWTSFPFFFSSWSSSWSGTHSESVKNIKRLFDLYPFTNSNIKLPCFSIFHGFNINIHYSNFVQETTLTVTCLFELSFNVSFRNISCIQLWLSLVQTFQTRNQCWENFQVNHGTVAFSRHLSELKSWLLSLGWFFRLSVSLELFLTRKSYAATKSCPYFSK